MPDEHPSPDSHAGPPGPFQYSLRTMFVLMTATAVVCSVLLASTGPVRLIGAGVIAVLLPTVLAVALVYGRGYARTFALGAMFPSGCAFLALAFFLGLMCYIVVDGPSRIWDAFWEASNGDKPSVAAVLASLVAVTSAFSLVTGLIAVFTRWAIEAPRRPGKASDDAQ